VLMAHVAFVLIGLASLLVTGIQAWRARRGPGSPAAESVVRYFRPGVNWPGRSLYAVLVLGVVLVLMSDSAYGFGDTFVQVGLVIWIACVGLAEMVVWPGERRLQRAVSESGAWVAPGSVAAHSSGVTPSGAAAPPDATDWKALGIQVALTAWVVCAALVVAVVLMVQKP
jgi:hypothetical protein